MPAGSMLALSSTVWIPAYAGMTVGDAVDLLRPGLPLTIAIGNFIMGALVIKFSGGLFCCA